MTTPKCSWPISQTQTVEFEVYSQNQGWNAVGGVYIFSCLVEGGWLPIYVGQAENFQARLPGHERLAEAVQLGATHIHARVVRQQAERDMLEMALIRHLQPSLNNHHK